MKWFRREPKPDPAETARQLRQQALDVSASQLGLAPTTGRPRVWGVLMETGYPEAAASLIAFADGTTSLYFSSGGGVIGAGQHAAVRAATEAFLAAAEGHLDALTPARDTSLPPEGKVRFLVRTFDGTLSGEADEDDLGNGRHRLSPLFHAGHAVIAAVRGADGRTEA